MHYVVVNVQSMFIDTCHRALLRKYKVHSLNPAKTKFE